MRTRAVYWWLCCLAGWTALAALQPARVQVDLTRTFSGYALVNGFPGAVFEQPVGLASAPGDRERLFVLERSGTISVITNLAQPSRTVFLDLRNTTYSASIEAGLLGVAFHPNYAANGRFFVARTVLDRKLTWRLSRFEVDAENPNLANAKETILIDQEDIADTHNAGDLHFGPDGYLYASVGDEGPTLADRRKYAQAIDGGLFGGILRIDVDQLKENQAPNAHPSVVGGYSIPEDNPFIGTRSWLGEAVNPEAVRTEFFAVGMRNPWRFTFDPLTGELIAGDVGSAHFEEVDLVVGGGNYGWPYWEGETQNEEEPPGLNETGPIFTYGRGRGLDQGGCVIGGVVSRGGSIADLEGWYVFADERSGNVWKLRPHEAGSVQWIAREPGLVGFGRDPRNGDILAASLMTGQIRRLIYVAPEEERVPQRLSATGIFTDLAALTPAAGIEPFQINVPFWSDNAIKRRWFGLMDDTKQFGYSALGNWTFPNGSVWVKHFELELEDGIPESRRRIETRLLVKAEEGFLGFTYRWNEEGTEAALVPSSGATEVFQIVEANGETREQTWIYPSRGDCGACHTKEGGGALGFNTAQLNLDVPAGAGTENQLERLARLGYLDAAPGAGSELPQLAKASATSEPLEHRVRSYLASNCAQCHQPGVMWGPEWDARWVTPLSEARIVDAIPHGVFTADNRVIAPRSLESSVMFFRLNTLSEHRMPPIGSTVLDPAARALLEEWILGMPDGSFAEYPIGTGDLMGSVTQREGKRMVSGIGEGLSDAPQDRAHLVGATLKGNGHVVAKVSGFPGARAGALGGVMLRSSADPTAAAIWLARDTIGRNQFLARTEANGPVAWTSSPAAGNFPWVRLTRDGNRVAAWESADGAAWQLVGESEFVSAAEALAGAAVASGESWRYATAEFEELQVASIEMEVIDGNPGAPLPRELGLMATVRTNNAAISRVEFKADGETIAVANKEPWRAQWASPWPGNHLVSAVAVDSLGLSITSAPVRIDLEGAPAIARFEGARPSVAYWQGSLGRVGYAIPGLGAELPARTTLNFGEAEAVTLASGGLLETLGGDRIASAWTQAGSLKIDYQPPTQYAHRVTLFLARYEFAGQATVSIYDPNTDEPLATETFRDLEGGVFASWIVRGVVRFEISTESALPASLSAIFLDELEAPMVSLEPIASPIILPQELVLRAEASAPGRSLQRVEFWDGETKLGEDAAAPYEFQWREALAGEHTLMARAIGEFGAGVNSEPVAVRCDLPAAGARFVREDRRTRGNWIGAYGSMGSLVPGGWTNLPPGLEVETSAFTFVFTTWTDLEGALKIPGDPSGGGYLACLVSPFGDRDQVRIRNRNGKPSRVTIYAADWFGPGRAQVYRFSNPATGEELAARSLMEFYDGVHSTWVFQGEVRLDVPSLNDFNTVVCGIFFDAPEAFSEWWAAHFPGVDETNARWMEDPDSDGRANLLEYAAGTNPLGEDAPILGSVRWDNGMVDLTLDVGVTPADARLVLETSLDLVNWEAADAQQLSGPSPVILRTDGTSDGGQFFRLRAEIIR